MKIYIHMEENLIGVTRDLIGEQHARERPD